MITSLADELKEIEEDYYFSQAKKQNLQVQLLHEKSRTDSDLEKALRGEFSFTEAIGGLAKEKYHGVGLFLPRKRDDAYDKRLDELSRYIRLDFKTRLSVPEKDTVFYRAKSWFENAVYNPVGAIVFAGALGVGFQAFLKLNGVHLENSPTYISEGLTWVMTVGITMSGYSIIMGATAIADAKKDARFLDAKCQQYRKHQYSLSF